MGPADPVVGPMGIGLPRVLVLTDRAQAAAAGHTLDEVAAAIAAFDEVALVLREKDLPLAERAALAVAIRALAPTLPLVLAVGGVLRADEQRVGVDVGVAGYHTAGGFMVDRGSVAWRGLTPHDHRATPWIGKSCHTVDDVRYAISGGATYVTISPVHATSSKPGYGPALGETGFARLVRVLQDEAAARATIAPVVYALGGIDEGNAAAALGAGAHGVAVMGAVMRAPDPAATLSKLRRSGTAGVQQLRNVGRGDR